MKLIIGYLSTLLLLVATLLPLLRIESWWIRMFDFPRLQLTILLVCLTGWNAALFDPARPATWLLVVVAAGCFLYQLWWIIQYTFAYPVEVESTEKGATLPSLRILTANVLGTNRHVDRLLALVRQNAPDILVTLETNQWWQDRLDVLEAEYPHTLKCPLDNLYGMHVYSKLPLENAEIKYLVEPDKPSMHALVKLHSGDCVRVHFLHPAPPSPTENESSSERDAEILVVARSVAETEAPVIVAGDLNDVAWSGTTRAFRKISGLRDPRIGRGMFNTFHAKHWFLRWPLDHLFHSHHFTLTMMRRLPAFGSDHFALLTELALLKDSQARKVAEDDGLTPDEDALELAQQKDLEEGVDVEDVPQPDKQKQD